MACLILLQSTRARVCACECACCPCAARRRGGRGRAWTSPCVGHRAQVLATRAAVGQAVPVKRGVCASVGRAGSPVTVTGGKSARWCVMGHAGCIHLCVIGCVSLWGRETSLGSLYPWSCVGWAGGQGGHILTGEGAARRCGWAGAHR